MTLSINSTLKLNNGIEIPRLGFGTYQIPPGEIAEKAVKEALKAGYRHIDTAAIYKNEESVGKGIKAIGISRSDFFLTTKLWNDDHSDVNKAFRTSLKNLNLNYVDLYLMHWPVERKRLASWKAMEGIYKEGKAKSIGVSNFTIAHLKELLEHCDVLPVLNQVEFHPYLYQSELHTFCKGHNIQLEAYSPLTQGQKLQEPTLMAIAEGYNKSTAQLLIRWALQHGIVVLPKSQTTEHIKSNADVFDFEISEKDMNCLDGLHSNHRVCWDPTNIP
ncbi:MAG: aldo/keto reductase [Nanoarchaeota archaeon]